MNTPRVSIVIPSFNKGRFIEETIVSVMRQTYPNIELIVIDARSDDETPAILKKYRHRIDRCVIEADEGQSDAINKGVKLASGDIVGWLNADDVLYEDGIQAVVDAFADDPATGVVYGSGSKIDIEGKIVKDIPFRAFDARLLKQLFYILQPSMYFKRRLFLQVGGLNKESHFAMDWELALKMLRITKFKAIPHKVAKLRMYAGTKTAAGGWECYREIATIGKKINGIRDVNYIAFLLRNLVCRINSPLPAKAVLRSWVDKLCDLIAGGDLYMVCHWPEVFAPENTGNRRNHHKSAWPPKSK